MRHMNLVDCRLNKIHFYRLTFTTCVKRRFEILPLKEIVVCRRIINDAANKRNEVNEIEMKRKSLIRYPLDATYHSGVCALWPSRPWNATVRRYRYRNKQWQSRYKWKLLTKKDLAYLKYNLLQLLQLYLDLK